jgi:hypothetical protein
MITIYLKTETQLGYIYFNFSPDQKSWVNIIEKFASSESMQVHLDNINDYLLKRQVENFYEVSKDNGLFIYDNARRKLYDLIQEAKNYTLKEYVSKLKEKGPEFKTIVKYSEDNKHDLMMFYKTIFNFIENGHNL